MQSSRAVKFLIFLQRKRNSKLIGQIIWDVGVSKFKSNKDCQYSHSSMTAIRNVLILALKKASSDTGWFEIQIQKLIQCFPSANFILDPSKDWAAFCAKNIQADKASYSVGWDRKALFI